MKRLPHLWLLLTTVQLAACASSNHCRRPQDYQSAPDRPPLVGTEGLQLPESAAALRIPPPVENPVGFGERGPDERWSCLDIPPPFTPTEDKPKS